jgi:hypothetical protein
MQGTQDRIQPPVSWADDLKPPSTRRTWGTATFAIPEFAQINECAYFDRHGLRARHLRRHQAAVDRFFGDLAAGRYASEVAQGYQSRLLKGRGKLFTFLGHDGVPWNNNNAEHAVKQFAYYRRTCQGHITAAGLEEYLVLLSIQQTCRYKGVSFLKFLLSRETDIDSFCAGAAKGRRRCRTGIPGTSRSAGSGTGSSRRIDR